MRQHYSRLDDNSNQAESSTHELELNPRKQQAIRKHLKTTHTNNETQSSLGKHKDMKSIYLEGIPANYQLKTKTQRINPRINTDGDNQEKLANQNRHTVRISRNQQNSFNEPNKTHDLMEIFNHNQDHQPQMHASKSQLMSDRKSNHRIQAHRAIIDAPETQLRIKKVLKEMKEEQIRQNRIKNAKKEQEWKEIQSLLVSKQENSALRTKEKEKDNKRRHQLEAAKELLTGKVAIIWIFIMSGQIEAADRNRIIKMYNGLSDNSYVVPLCNKVSQIKTFLEVPKSLFKIVADLQNFSEALKYKTHSKVVQFYIFNDQGEKGISRALSYKAQSRKVKGIFTILKKIIDRAQQQIENEVQIFRTNKGLTNKGSSNKKFPSFIKLSGEDKTYATLYRANLYGAKNMQKSELKEKYEDFMSLIDEKYGNQKYEKQNIDDYCALDHFQKQITINQAKEVIKFYVRQSFYYQILNSMLRTMKTTQEFKPCIFPFYETYHSIKIFYQMDLKQSGRIIKKQTLYRGARLRPRDFANLKPGVYIEMLGFMSTSKSLERALQFCDRDGYIFIVEVPELNLVQKYDKYDHGFVDINKHELANKQFSVQEQVLFNALNIFKVTKVEMDGQIHLIYLQYGPIFDLLGKEKYQMTSDQRDVLLNYQYCAHMLEQIEDQGDVYLLANEFESSKQYYNNKLKDNVHKEKYLYKLANVQQQCGELDEASKNANISLQMQLNNLDINDKQKCLKVFSIHSKNAHISLDQQDYLHADEAITYAIDMLGDDNQFEKAKKLRERGDVKFKKGQLIEAQKDYFGSEIIFKNLTNKAENRKKQINRKYLFSFLTLICSSTTQQQIQFERQANLKEVHQIEKQIRNMEEIINDQLIKVNKSLAQVAHYAEDKQKYQICVKKARGYLLGVQSRKTNDPMQKAKLKALQATIQEYLQLAESQKLLLEAIDLVQSNQPFNPNVGKYSQILASIQKKELEKYTNPKSLLSTKLQIGMEPIKFNDQEHHNIYSRCKKNFEKAISVLMYNQNSKKCPELVQLKNQLGELEFYENNFENSESIIREAKAIQIDGGHSQISRSSLLLSKIGYARGELKSSFQNVEQAIKVLRNAIVKKEQQKYLAIFQSNDLRLEIKLQRSKIYLKQMQHDLSLKDLDEMKVTIQKKIDYKDNHSLLADICEIRGENCIAKAGQFWVQFQKALKIREKQIGECNLANAVTYCNYSKYLILAKETKDAQKMLHKALQIFSCFSEDHPITWLVLYCSGLLKQRLELYDDSVTYIRKSLLRIKQNHDKSHITVNKIRLQLAKVLHKDGKISQSIKELEDLQCDLENEITASQIRNKIEDERDDEKISVKRMLYQSLKQSYQQMNKIDVSNLNETTLALDKCEQKINNLKNTYKFQTKTKK